MTEQLLIVVSVTFLCMVGPGPDMAIVVRNTFHGGQTLSAGAPAGVWRVFRIDFSYRIIHSMLLLVVFSMNKLQFKKTSRQRRS